MTTNQSPHHTLPAGVSDETVEERVLQPGKFYWVKPVFDVDFVPPGFEGQDHSDALFEAAWNHWSQCEQPALFLGHTEGRVEKWIYLDLEEDAAHSDEWWPARWIGPEISLAHLPPPSAHPGNLLTTEAVEGVRNLIDSALSSRINLWSRHRLEEALALMGYDPSASPPSDAPPSGSLVETAAQAIATEMRGAHKGGVTEQDRRAARAALSAAHPIDETNGHSATWHCPICGFVGAHHHTTHEIAAAEVFRPSLSAHPAADAPPSNNEKD